MSIESLIRQMDIVSPGKAAKKISDAAINELYLVAADATAKALQYQLNQSTQALASHLTNPMALLTGAAKTDALRAAAINDASAFESHINTLPPSGISSSLLND